MKRLAIFSLGLFLTLALFPAVLPASAQSDDGAICRTSFGDAALAACDRAIASGRYKDSELAIFHNRRGVELEKKSDYAAALPEYSEAIRLDPNWAIPLTNRGFIYRRSRDYDRAIADFSAAMKINPKYVNPVNGRGLVRIEKGEIDAGLADLNEATKIDPRFAGAYGNRGYAYRLRNDFDRAIAEYDTAIGLDGKNPNWYRDRGLSWRGKGDLDRAIKDFDEALRFDGRFVAAWLDRGATYERKDEFDVAIDNFTTAIRLNPNSALAYVDRTRVYLDKGDFEFAVADAEQAVRLGPNSGNAVNMRGLALKLSGQLDRALPDFDEAIRLTPKFAAPYGNRGDVYRQKGDLDRAIADLSEGIHLDPKFITAFTNRGLAYEAKGEIELAKADFRSALSFTTTRNIRGREAMETARTRLAALAPDARVSNNAAAADPSPKPGAAHTTERRVALVIGNGSYRFVPQLPNATRDADAIATALRSVGFEIVELESDLSREKMVEALRGFSRLAEKADWALVYYAGHGIEMNGTNYLIPVDARLETDRDLQFEALPLDQLLATVEGARKLRIILLDACRENPFGRMRRTVATRSIGRGLARIEPEGGTLVAYAAKHGEVALDGDGANSPFVSAIVKRIATPGVEINKLFRLVRDDVLAATAHKQEPFVYGSLPGDDFYFSPPLAKNRR